MKLPLPSRANRGLILGASALLIVICGAICVGAASIEAFNIGDPVLRLRLPRVLLAAVVGSALGMSGAASQALLRNPLAEPGTLGVGMGAAAGAAMVVVLMGSASTGPSAATMLPFLTSAGAFTVALAVASCVVAVAGATSLSLAPVLTGLALSAVSNAVLGALTIVANDFQLRSLAFWTLGSLGQATPAVTSLAAAFIFPALILLGRQGQALNAWLLGDAVAGSLGIDVRATRKSVIIWSSVLAAAAIAPCGFVAFIGLLAPQVARVVTGSNQRASLPMSALTGAVLVVLADVIARTIVAPAELPVGVITSLIGAPLFAVRVFEAVRRSQ